MPNKDPEIARQKKRAWYTKHREELLERKRKQEAARKKLRPPKPPPTDEAKAKAQVRALNKEACDRYRASHLEQVRAINLDYYHRHRERLTQQQRDRRARAKQQRQTSFRALRALADVCAARLLELDHGYAKIEPTPEKAGPREEQAQPEILQAMMQSVHRWHSTGEGPEPSALPRTHHPYERIGRVPGLQS